MFDAPALQVVPSSLREWRDGLSRLKPTTSPCSGLAGPVWAQIHEHALAFLEQHGAQAADLGWTAEDLFGVHPKVGTVRVDYCGALVLGGGAALGVQRDRISFRQLTYYRDVPGRQVGVPLWAFRG